jgi:isopenicillin-N N-acyltransferase-like protein
MNDSRHLRIDGIVPWRRGYDRGRRTATAIARSWRTYSELFEITAATSGVTLDVPALALGTVAATRAWAPDLVDEMQGIADGAGVPLWVVAALNARTEILAMADAPRAGECSAVVHTGGHTLGGQSWDWHDELADGWHVQSVRGDVVGFAGLTEHGILAKIGVNEAGVGILFNILGHVDDGHLDDGAAGVPVHLVARRVLGTATSFDDALAILAQAPVSASTVMTVVTPDRSACVEVSPAGVGVVAPDDNGWLLHTNHFVDPTLARGELRGRREPETFDRLRVLSARVAARVDGRPGLDGVDDLASLLTVHPEDGAEVCCHPPVNGRLGSRWATLATVAVEPAARRLLVHAGGPCSAQPSTWMSVTAPTTNDGAAR